ncbi:glycosyltransferase family 4 protein [Metabacillus herbersteinensis]|uniref:Glycosyltransferase family 4 protein n=1 Tax=Metabacillus herbersteinensis TaxID=283816 RepID=A0ABV6GGE4_9BACI
MKKVIVYYPYSMRELTSGSAVRPRKMLEAFQELGVKESLEIIEIFGDSIQREKLLTQLYNEVNPTDILYCYMENATIPMWLTDKDHIPRKPFLEIKFFKYLKSHNIPLGIFYRDAYWKFNDLYTVRQGVKQGMQFLFKAELSLFKKYSDIYYLPSQYMNEYIQFPDERVVALPPGGIDFIRPDGPLLDEQPRAIYVGGIHPRYGVYEMLNAFQKLNKEETQITLTFVCRKEELAKFTHLMEPYINSSWIQLIHASGEELMPLYRKADFGIVPIKKDVYNDFAVAVKMFEYLSYGLPMIATNCNAQMDLVNDGNFGIIVESNEKSIYNALQEMLDPKKRDELKHHAILALKEKHLWYHRALTVHETLTN